MKRIKGQIEKALSGFYYINHQGTLYQTRARGNFRAKQESPLVGDIVEFEASNEKEGVVTKIYPRKNQLVRPPMANIDVALVVISSVEPEFSQNLLDRYLVTLENLGIQPLIYLSKTDLAFPAALEELCAYYRSIGYAVISSDQKDALDAILAQTQGKLTVLMGQSGAGKSTLLNTLLPDLNLKTDEISNYLNRGKHTTRHVEIHQVSGSPIADTPGFSAIDLRNISAENLSQLFVDIDQVGRNCRFRTCLHLNEPDCAVKAEAKGNRQFKQRYENYLQFLKEIQGQRPQYQKNKRK